MSARNSIITVTHRLLTLTHNMKSFVALLAVVAVVAADVSHVLQDEKAAVILGQEADVLPDQFKYSFETSNGIFAQEAGTLQNLGPDAAAIVVQGSNSYTNPQGQKIETTYIADQNGYQPQGAHLPTPPPTQPIPDYILRSIEYNARNAPAPVNPSRI